MKFTDKQKRMHKLLREAVNEANAGYYGALQLDCVRFTPDFFNAPQFGFSIERGKDKDSIYLKIKSAAVVGGHNDTHTGRDFIDIQFDVDFIFQNELLGSLTIQSIIEATEFSLMFLHGVNGVDIYECECCCGNEVCEIHDKCVCYDGIECCGCCKDYLKDTDYLAEWKPELNIFETWKSLKSRDASLKIGKSKVVNRAEISNTSHWAK